MSRATVAQLRKKDRHRPPLVAITAYDYTFARLADQTEEIDILLVGDSVGMVVQGQETTLPVTLDEMVYHTRSVVRGRSRAFVVADLPLRAYKGSPAQALESSLRLLAEGGCEMVKLEGGASMFETVTFLTQRGIPVMGHLGLTPQFVHQFGGYRIQGRDPAAAEALVEDACGLERAGARALVLEAVPQQLAKRVTETLGIPVLGIGAGPNCDGQVLVIHDVLGLLEGYQPTFTKRYLEGAEQIREALQAYGSEVRSGDFPGPEHCFD